MSYESQKVPSRIISMLYRNMRTIKQQLKMTWAIRSNIRVQGTYWFLKELRIRLCLQANIMNNEREMIDLNRNCP